MFEKATNVYEERINWLRLLRSENVGNKTFQHLVSIYSSATLALEHIQDLAANGGLKRKIKVCSREAAELEVEATSKFGAEFVYAMDIEYPANLLGIPDYPPIIIVKGKKALLNDKQNIGIVGSRNASISNCNFAKSMAKQLGEAGFTIISGMAKGIDQYAHMGSIDTGSIGVIAGGIDNVYPLECRSLFEKMYKVGLIVAELPINTAPLSRHFPQRNRIIAALSQGVAVIEAALKSGSLITAKFAKEYKKPIFAVPGSPLDHRCVGANQLIKKEGAILLNSALDIIDYYREAANSRVGNALCDSKPQNFSFPINSLPSARELAKYRTLVLDSLSFTPITLEEVMEHLNLSLNIITLLVLELELAGRIERIYPNKIALKS
jgi:DNA processing protein